MSSEGELLGAEDCLNDLRLRTTTLKCISQTGELLEINYSDFMNNIKLVESSMLFLENFVKDREEDRKHQISYGKYRHYMAESIEIRTKPRPKPNLIMGIPKYWISRKSILTLNDCSKISRVSQNMNSKKNIMMNFTSESNLKIFKFTETNEEQEPTKKIPKRNISATINPYSVEQSYKECLTTRNFKYGHSKATYPI